MVGTPGRILALARDKDLPLKNVRHFILDECDKMLDSLGRLLFSGHFLMFIIVHFSACSLNALFFVVP